MANTFYGEDAAPAVLCPTEALRSCLTHDLVAAFATPAYPQKIRTNLNIHLYGLSYCMEKVCPARAKTLAPLLAPFRVKRWVAKRDVRLDLGADPRQLFMPRGTVVAGVSWNEFGANPAAVGNKPTIITPEAVALKGAADGKEYTGIYELPFVGPWDDAFGEAP